MRKVKLLVFLAMMIVMTFFCASALADDLEIMLTAEKWDGTSEEIASGTVDDIMDTYINSQSKNGKLLAENYKSATVTFLKDINRTDPWYFRAYADKVEVITIDLNGHTCTFKNASSSDITGISMIDNSQGKLYRKYNLTDRSGSASGSVIRDSESQGYVDILYCNGCEVNIEKGTYDSNDKGYAVKSYNGSDVVVINDGTISGPIRAYGTVVINGGELTEQSIPARVDKGGKLYIKNDLIFPRKTNSTDAWYQDNYIQLMGGKLDLSESGYRNDGKIVVSCRMAEYSDDVKIADVIVSPAGYGWINGSTSELSTDLLDPSTTNVKNLINGGSGYAWLALAMANTVYFKMNDGTDDIYTYRTIGVSGGVSYTFNDFKPTTDPEREGYEFAGWTTNQDDKDTLQSDASSVTFSDDRTCCFYALWKKVYTISYELNGGEFSDDGYPKSYAKGDTIELPTDVVREEYTFVGWFDNEKLEGTNIIGIGPGESDNKTFYAKWERKTYAITVKTATNGVVQPKIGDQEVSTAPKDAEVELACNANEYYELEELKYYPTGEETQYNNILSDKKFTMPAYPVTVEAKFGLINYDITYTLNGGTNADSNPATYTFETETITLQEPTKKGYTFKGWYKEPTYENKITAISKGSYGAITLYAKWEATTYTITYEMCGGTNAVANPTSYTIESENITLADPTREGYTFDGWTGEGLTTATKEVTISKGSTGDRKYTATWTGESGISYTVIHHFEDINSPGNDGYKWDEDTTAQTENKTGTAGAQTEAAVLNPVPAGFTARGVSPETTDAPPTITQEVIEGDGSTEVDLYYTRNEYTLKIDCDNAEGDSDVSETDYRYGASLATAFPTDLTKTTKVGTDEDGNDVKVDLELIGWVMLSADGSEVTDNDGARIVYTATGDNKLPATMPAKDLWFRAEWVAPTGTVTPVAAVYDVQHYKKTADGGYALNETERLTGTLDEEVIAKAKSYTGFAVNETASTLKKNLEKPSVQDGNLVLTTLKVYYDPIEYSITYQLAGGALPENTQNPATYTVLDCFTLVNPERAGYTFVGWTGTDLKDASMVVQIADKTGERSYTASWTANQTTAYTVNHYFQNVDDDNYTLRKKEMLAGETDTPATYSALTGNKITGFELAKQPSTTPTYIQGNGSTVIDLYYDRMTYTLTFKPANGENDSVSTLRYGAAITAPAEPVWNGYTFIGWHDENGVKVESLPATMPANNLTYTADWAANAGIMDKNSAYQVKHFRQNLDGTYSEVLEDREFPLYARVGSVVDATTNTYEGFELNAEDSKLSAELVEARMGDDGQPVLTTLECYYDRKKIKIIIKIEGDEDIVINGVFGEEIPEPTPPAKDNFDFSHWVDEDGNPVIFPIAMPSEDLIIYPVYTGNPPVFIVPTEAQNVTVYEGEQAVLEARATNNPSYQWYINRNDGLGWVAINSATNTVYTSSATKLSNNGYRYYCKATNNAGSAESEIFQLEVLQQVVLPETGDNSNIEWYLLLCAASLAGIGILVWTKRKVSRKQN